MLAFCDTLGLDEVDLVANDTGGAVAQIFAARHPERLRTFTLTNCETHDNVPPEAFKPTVDLARAGGCSRPARRHCSPTSLSHGTSCSPWATNAEFLPPDIVGRYLEPVIGTPERARNFERFLCALDPADLLAVEPRSAELTVPTLVVWGTGDVFFEKRWAYWLRDTIPGASEVVEIDGARLFFPDERAADLVPHLRRHWLASADHAS